jgi:hypothetical protein
MLDSAHDGSFDRTQHHKKIKQWFMNPEKFKAELEAEQKKHVGKCIYHLTKSHPTCDCFIKKECEKLIAARKNSPSSTISGNASQGQLRHLTEDQEAEEEIVEDVTDSMPDMSGNDTNEEALFYFARVSNHYLRLGKSNSWSIQNRHHMAYPIIADSGANFHMFKSLEFFTSMVPAHAYVTLGDGKTKIPIQGIGIVKCIIDDHTLEIPNVRFVPGLSESIYSLLQHIKQPNHGINSSYETGLHIKFPDFQTAASVGNDDIYLNAFPCPDNKSSTANISYHSVPTDHVQDQGICHHVSHITSTSIKDMKTSDHLLKELRTYYDDVRQQRKLSLPLPSGFRQQTNLQRMYQSFTPPCKSTVSDDQTNISTEQTTNRSSSTAQTLPSLHRLSEDSCTNNSVESHVPILQCIDKVSSHLPSNITFSEDIIRASVSFRRIDTIKNHLGHLYQNTVKLDGLPADAVLDLGDVSTLSKVARNTVPVPRPKHFADVIHMDIVFGPEVSIGNIHYGLMFTDRFSCMTWIYPMHNLTSDIIKQLDAYFARLGILPKRLISDFDTKLIGGKARDHLNSLNIHVNAAPANRQDKNGLVERHWQTMVAMARNWLASAELPASFGFMQ